MTSNLPRSEFIEDSKTELKLKIEIKKLQEQNLKLINKLEHVTYEFYNFQTKHSETNNSNQYNINGSVHSFLEKNKVLEDDNKKLSEELKNQINVNKMNESNASRNYLASLSSDVCALEDFKILAEKKIVNLGHQVEELQDQIKKSQKQAHKTECEYKRRQIQALESLRSCKIENDSLKEKIFDNEKKMKNMVQANVDNFNMRTTLERVQGDYEALKLELRNAQRKLVQSESLSQNQEQDKKAYEDQLCELREKISNLCSENQSLLSTIKETEKLHGTQQSHCCESSSEQYLRMNEQLKIVLLENDRLKEEKLSMDEQFVSQGAIIEAFEQQQNKLREEIDHLNSLKCSFDITLRSKSNDVENLTCQLESYSQRLEIREHRTNELISQLAIKSSEETNMQAKLEMLTDKFERMQIEVSRYQTELSENVEENQKLSITLSTYESDLSEQNRLNDHLKHQLDESILANLELEKSLQSVKSANDARGREFTKHIEDLTEKIEELNYSISIYEQQNEVLESDRKRLKSELHTFQVNETKAREIHKNETERYEFQNLKSQEEITNYKLAISERNDQITDLKAQNHRLDQKIIEKELEIASVSAKLKAASEELDQVQMELSKRSQELQNHQAEKGVAVTYKVRCDEALKKLQRSKRHIEALSQKIDELNISLTEEQQKFESLKTEFCNAENAAEKMRVKMHCVQEELAHKNKLYENCIEAQKLEQAQTLNKLHSAEDDYDQCCKKLRAHEETVHRLEVQLARLQEEVETSRQLMAKRKEDLEAGETANRKLESKIAVLHDHLKCSQIKIVERSREIDRLEQLVADRSEQIEVRSNQLQIFEKHLEEKLVESQARLDNAKQEELLRSAEIDNLKQKNGELSSALSANNRRHEELQAASSDKEKECSVLTSLVSELEGNNKALEDKMSNLKNDLKCKTILVKELLEKIQKQDASIESLTEELEARTASLKAKEWNLQKVKDQAKFDKCSSIEVEAHLKSELKSCQRKLEQSSITNQKEIDSAIQKFSSTSSNQAEEMKSMRRAMERGECELKEMTVKVYEKEVHIADLKSEVAKQTQLIGDLDRNCQLKETVIQRLLQKINNLSLDWNLSERSLSDNADVKSTPSVTDKTVKCHVASTATNDETSLEDISLQELLARINLRLNV